MKCGDLFVLRFNFAKHVGKLIKKIVVPICLTVKYLFFRGVVGGLEQRLELVGTIGNEISQRVITTHMMCANKNVGHSSLVRGTDQSIFQIRTLLVSVQLDDKRLDPKLLQLVLGCCAISDAK